MAPAMTAIMRWFCEELRYMCDLMSAIPEGDGTMLDHTLIVFANELARGNYHSLHPMPYLLVGGAGGAIRTGRFIDYRDVENNRLLVAIAQAFGLNVERFGTLDQGGGALAGILR